jgi:hypothetical protein
MLAARLIVKLHFAIEAIAYRGISSRNWVAEVIYTHIIIAPVAVHPYQFRSIEEFIVDKLLEECVDVQSG